MRELGLLENDRQTLYEVSTHYKNFLYGFEQVRTSTLIAMGE